MVFYKDVHVHVMCKKIILIVRQHREIYSSLSWQLNQNCLVAKEEMLVIWVTVLFGILSTGMAYSTMPVLTLRRCHRKG